MPNSIADIDIKDWALYIGWGLTILGWYQQNKNANNRELRKEAKAEIEECNELALDILEQARNYYTSDPGSSQPETSAKIKFDIYRLLSKTERLQNRYPEFDVINACSELLESITGNSFESSDRRAEKYNSDLILKMESDTHFLIEQLDIGFYTKFNT